MGDVTIRELINELVRLSGMRATDIIHLLDKLNDMGLCIMPKEATPGMMRAYWNCDPECGPEQKYDEMLAAFQKQLRGE